MQKVITYGILHFNPTMYGPATEKFVEAFESLMENKNPDISSEVYLIDQGNPEPEKEIMRMLAKRCGCHLLSFKENIGISRGINTLFNLSRSEYICLVTSDVVFPNGLDSGFIKELEADKSILQICPLSDLSSIEYQKGPVTGGDPIKCIAQELTIQMWPRRCLEVTGYFNETFKAAYENLDYALRLFISGHYAAISQKVKCQHYHNMTSKSGAIERAYDNYISMPNGFYHATIRRLWDQRWSVVSWDTLYEPKVLTKELQYFMNNYLSSNIYMPYVQDVNY